MKALEARGSLQLAHSVTLSLILLRQSLTESEARLGSANPRNPPVLTPQC